MMLDAVCATNEKVFVAQTVIFLSVLHALCEKILENLRIASKNYTKYNKTIEKENKCATKWCATG